MELHFLADIASTVSQNRFYWNWNWLEIKIFWRTLRQTLIIRH